MEHPKVNSRYISVRLCTEYFSRIIQNSLTHSSVVKRTLGKSHDFDCAFDYDLIGQILFDFRSHSHLTFLREVEVMTLTLVMTKVMTTTF